MTEQTEQVLNEAIAVADLPWGTNPLLTAGMTVQVVKLGLKEILRGRLAGLKRHRYEVAISTARGNRYSFMGYKNFADAVELVENLAKLTPGQLAGIFVEIDQRDLGSRSEVLLAQWREVCLAWTWGHFAPGDVVCLDEATEVETVDGLATLPSGSPFEINDILLEEERRVLARTINGDVVSLDMHDITLLAEERHHEARRLNTEFFYKSGHGYVEV